MGAFVTQDISANARIEVGIEIRTVSQWEVTERFGQWVNHCPHGTESAKIDMNPDVRGQIWVVAARDLIAGDEITVDYDAIATRGLIAPSQSTYTPCRRTTRRHSSDRALMSCWANSTVSPRPLGGCDKRMRSGV